MREMGSLFCAVYTQRFTNPELVKKTGIKVNLISLTDFWLKVYGYNLITEPLDSHYIKCIVVEVLPTKIVYNYSYYRVFHVEFPFVETIPTPDPKVLTRFTKKTVVREILPILVPCFCDSR